MRQHGLVVIDCGADWKRFMTGLPGRLNVVFSLGDVVILAGVGALVVRAMTAPGPVAVAA